MNMRAQSGLPIAVIGAGPIGLAAAARILSYGFEPIVLERGATVGASMLDWGHVRVFSPWRYNIDEAARALLEPSGWQAPPDDALPTGADIVTDYLAPLAALPVMRRHIRLGTRVTAVSRFGHDKVANAGRDDTPFVLTVQSAAGSERILARAVIDASGTWTAPNPAGTDGLAVLGEEEAAGQIVYGIPDICGNDRAAYAGKRVLVIGAGHSAINAALDLVALQADHPDTTIFWALRGSTIEKLLGGGLNDQLPERGALGLAAKKAIEAGRLTMLASFAATHISRTDSALQIDATLAGKPYALAVDRMIVATGFRPDLSFLRELRIALDPAVEAPPALAPLIDPNLHSCGTVPPHGVGELSHPEKDFYIVGAKSYGRAPTFLMMTGYEQARSVVAELAGERDAARQVRLVLPETGICVTGATPAADTCCGGPAVAESDACCKQDEAIKAEGGTGCGCAEATAQPCC